ncbi:helix-turn-helix domain-containing protein [Pedobacter caeni]|uniref:Transcriptional regulator, AraC family n=1 Tax=Pedobacter caeni TaxID=288992 RepID=A0A1M5HUC4_9SPHI|nr:helix-turn-helix domain-containing protein [Pedobacter caeni]SHG19503.1 transcriptional regulator, AraC family [Pedobacter caeni]
MNAFFMCFSAGASFLLSFLLFFHPLRENLTANKWLALFVSIMGSAFLGIYLNHTEIGESHPGFIQWINGLQFILPPSLFLSTQFFINPVKVLSKKDWIHFVPFLIFLFLQVVFAGDHAIFMKAKLFEIGNTSFLFRDILPFQLLLYLCLSYLLLLRHKKNLRKITASIQEIDLNWLSNFLLILTVILIFWINDTLFGIPFLIGVMPIIYTASIFFLAYFSIRQRTVFAFNKKDLKDISTFLESPAKDQLQKTERLNDQQFALLSAKLNELMTKERLFLDNNLSLPMLADQLEISIHDTSYLINRLTEGNFYHFINRLRVEEARQLLSSNRVEELNMLGIAFASGFNSKTTFNTAFKKYAGISPSAYVKQQRTT